MNRKLPKVYANKIENRLNNNERVFCSFNKLKEEEKNSKNENIEVKINKLFKSSKYVYKLNVEITTQNGTNIYKIVGKNRTHLVTLDNELIPISSIVDIKEI